MRKSIVIICSVVLLQALDYLQAQTKNEPIQSFQVATEAVGGSSFADLIIIKGDELIAFDYLYQSLYQYDIADGLVTDTIQVKCILL